jgi:ornithine racemase
MMRKNPALVINLQKIQHNARTITKMCRQHGISVAGVTKGFCAIPEVAEAMLVGGCSMLADSRVKNLQKLQEGRFNVDNLLLRPPMLSEVEEVVRHADCSLNTEIDTIKALNEAARQLGLHHKIILMIDIGDLREGIWPDQVPAAVKDILRCTSIVFEGIGCNLGCYGGVLPTSENMTSLLKQKEYIEQTHHLQLAVVSGGSTCGIRLLCEGGMPEGINHFRIGEGILLGKSTSDRFLIPDTYQDAFTIRAEIIECNEKPSIPIGLRGCNAFGKIPEFDDNGIRKRAILALGNQDVVTATELSPCDQRITILGATSDHLLVDISETTRTYAIGDTIDFSLNYTTLLAAATSEYMHKEFS